VAKQARQLKGGRLAGGDVYEAQRLGGLTVKGTRHLRVWGRLNCSGKAARGTGGRKRKGGEGLVLDKPLGTSRTVGTVWVHKLRRFISQASRNMSGGKGLVADKLGRVPPP